MSRSNSSRSGGSIVREITITDPTGFHCKPAAQIAKIALNYEGEITVEKDGSKVSAKSVMGLLGLLAVPEKSMRFRVMAEGPDAEGVISKIQDVVSGKYEEVK